MARSIRPITINQAISRKTVMTHPVIWIPLDWNAFPTANVAVIKAVFGKMNENHGIPKVKPPCGRTHDQCAPADTRKNQKARPQIQRHVQFAMTLRIIDAICPSPMKSLSTFRESESAMPMTPATVNPLGPTETNMPGLEFACGSFCVISR
ncbi:MAG: hypothetical protein Q9188_007511 [Gyalolechia gomerana]